ncbi:MAG: ABC transporter ATP-binding protein [Rectinemataceae bacterium]|jgi:simple sugar transport system ATP-binding protein
MENFVEMRCIRNEFPGVIANDDVDFSLQRGEIRALVGENGAGKTTLMRTLYGMQHPTKGEILVEGTKLTIRSPREAISAGFGMIHQHFMLIPTLDAVENIILGVAPTKRLLFTDIRAAETRVRELMDRFHLQVPFGVKVQDLTVGDLQRVEILKALYRDVELLILDEPTAILTPQETEGLFNMMREFAASGKTIVFISHKLREVKAVAQSVTVMRKGRVVGNEKAGNVTEHDIARMMVGREVLFEVEKAKANPGEIILHVHSLRALNARGLPALRGVDFTVHSDEIVGIAGVEGNGQSELAECIAGMWPATDGEIKFLGNNIRRSSLASRRNRGIAYIPEDRLKTGLCEDMTLWENLIVDDYGDSRFAFWKGLLLKHRAIEEFSERLILDYSIMAPGAGANIGTLSGGNQQKTVLAREMSRGPRLLVVSQPTRGVDMGAIEFIHRKLVALRDAGCAILMVSADLQEVINLADRILVLYDGEIVGEIEGNGKVDEKRIGCLMAGLRPEESICE